MSFIRRIIKSLRKNEGIKESTNTLIEEYSEAYSVYPTKIDLEEATKRLRKIRERYGIKLVALDSSRSMGYYHPSESIVQIEYSIPFSPVISIDEYKTIGVKSIEIVAPHEWNEVKNILKRIITNPYYAQPNPKNKEQKKEFYEIKTRWEEIRSYILKKLKIEEVRKKVEETSRKKELYKEFKEILYRISETLYHVYEFRTDRTISLEDVIREVSTYLKNLREISKKEPSLQDYLIFIEDVVRNKIEKFGLKSLKKEDVKGAFSLLRNIYKSIENSLNDLEFQERILSLYLKNVGIIIGNIDNFINSSPEKRIDTIVNNLANEIHETAHAVFRRIIETYFRIPTKKIYSDYFLSVVDESFAMLFEFYHLLSQVEMGFIPPKAISHIVDTIFMCTITPSFLHYSHLLEEKDKKYISIFSDTCKLLGLEEISENIKNIDFSNLSQQELREKVRSLRKEIRKNIERIVGTLKENPEFVVSEDPSRYDKLIEKLFS